MKRFFYLTIAPVLAMMALCAAAEAEEPPLPCGLRWGAPREYCEEVISAGGYSRLIRAEDYASSKSPNRVLKRVRETQGISVLEFERGQKEATETLKIYLYKDRLFQIEITFDDTKQSFADKLVEDITRSTGRSPQFAEGKDSKLQMYAWTFPVTVIIFSCRYRSSVPTSFAVLEYRDEPLWNELKARGLM